MNNSDWGSLYSANYGYVTDNVEVNEKETKKETEKDTKNLNCAVGIGKVVSENVVKDSVKETKVFQEEGHNCLGIGKAVEPEKTTPTEVKSVKVKNVEEHEKTEFKMEETAKPAPKATTEKVETKETAKKDVKVVTKVDDKKVNNKKK